MKKAAASSVSEMDGRRTVGVRVQHVGSGKRNKKHRRRASPALLCSAQSPAEC